MATTVYTTIDDVEALFRTLSEDEKERAAQLIPIVEDAIRQEAINRGRNLDEMVENGQLITNVLVSVVVDVIGRTLNASTTAEPMSQYSQSALGYSMSGTYLVPGGGLFIKNSELRRLGIFRQRWGSVDMLGGV